MDDFIAALEQRDLEKISSFPKSDLHNHFVLGGSREYLWQMTGVQIKEALIKASKSQANRRR